MNFTDICLITEDVKRLARFYEAVFQGKAEGDAVHSALPLPGMVLAIYSKRAAEQDMGFDFSRHWGTGGFTFGFDVADVDAESARMQKLGVEFVTSPTTWPWGARSFHFRDPDGNIVCFRTWVGERT